MADMLWWRSWHGAPMDHKWTVIALKAKVNAGIVSAVAWALMDYASQNKDRGSITGFDVETYAVFSGFTEDDINAVIQAMTKKEMIIDGKFINWEKRQPKSEKDIARVTEWRAEKRNAAECYDVLQDVTKSYTDKIREDKNRKENKQPAKTAVHSVVQIPDKLNTELFIKTWIDWLDYRSAGKKKIPALTQERQLALLSKYPPSVAVAIINQSITNGWQGLFPLKDRPGTKQAEPERYLEPAKMR